MAIKADSVLIRAFGPQEKGPLPPFQHVDALAHVRQMGAPDAVYDTLRKVVFGLAAANDRICELEALVRPFIGMTDPDALLDYGSTVGEGALKLGVTEEPQG